MFRLFECCALSFFERFVLSLFLKIERFVSDSAEIWICGLYIKENKFTLWNSSDGFPSNEILFAYQKPFNRDFIYLGGAEGLVKINTNIPYSEVKTPEIYLSDILFNGSPYIKELQNNTIEIPWNYNSLSVHFRIKKKDIFQKNLLRYTVSGRGNQEIESYDPFLNLSSLSPGKYAIWVSCNMKNGNYTTPKRLVDIIVTPPWYKTGWFISIIILIFISVTTSTGYIIFRRKEQSMKGSMSHFLQAILNDILKNKEEKFQATEEELQNTTVPLTVLSEQVKENNNEPTQQKQTVTKEDEDFIDKLNKLINDNMAGEELSIKFLTDNMAMSRASLYHKVKTLTGLGVNDYINRLRIEKSVYLLTNTNLNINEISYEVGFTYPRYFSTSFKQIKGMTPTQFKEEKKKNNADSK